MCFYIHGFIPQGVSFQSDNFENVFYFTVHRPPPKKKRDINEDKTNNVEINERSNLDESDDGNLIPIAKEHSDKKGDGNKNLDLIEDRASTKLDISNVSDRVNRKESLPINSDLVNKRLKTNDIENKLGKSKRSWIKFIDKNLENNRNTSLSILLSDNAPDSKVIDKARKEIIENIKCE